MKTPLKILVLEDTREDVFLIERELKQSGMLSVLTVATTKEEFEKSLREISPDIILADHSLPSFNSIEALNICRAYQFETKKVTPFILVTGSVSEEFAAQIIKSGADDYILKDRLRRLPSAVQNAFEKARIANERTKFLDEIISNEAMMREAEQLAHFGSWQVDLLTGVHKWSDESYRIFGYEPRKQQVTNETFLEHVHPEDRKFLKEAIDETILYRDSFPCEFRIIDRNGKVKHILSSISVKRNQEQVPVQLLGFNLDVTEQKKQTETLALQNKRLIEIAWIQSHEVRAPLARLMGLIDIMETNANEEKIAKEFWKPLLESAHELDSIIRKIVRKTEALGETENSNG